MCNLLRIVGLNFVKRKKYIIIAPSLVVSVVMTILITGS